MIKNIIFDIGNVLVEFCPDKAMEKAGIDKERIAGTLDATVYSSLWIELDRGVMDEKDVEKEMIKRAPEYRKEISLFFEKGKEYVVSIFSYAAEWIKELKNQGYQVYLLSNYPVSFFELHSKMQFNFLEYVDGKVVSAYVKMIKPDAEIYQHILEKYNLIAEECVFLDDREENVEAAVEEGIQGIIFTNYEEVKEKLNLMLQQ